MAKENTKPVRVSKRFCGEIDDALNTRVKLNLMKAKDVNFPKGIELLRKTQGYRLSLEELKTKREKRK